MWHPRGNVATVCKIDEEGEKSLLQSESGSLSSTETSANPHQTAWRRNFQKAEVLFVFNLAERLEYLENGGVAPRILLLVTAA
jgi:hypothetical protein